MIVQPNLEQRSEAWFRLRAGRPTASNFSKIITASGKDSDQWEDFVYELCAACIRPDEIQWEGNRHTDRGNELEPEAIEEFSRIMGLETEIVGFITRDDGIIGCSPDALVLQTLRRIAGLEVKCPLAKIQARRLIEQLLPDEYKAQVHGSMAVTGLRFWYFMSYCPGLKPMILRIEWDEYTDKVADALDRFLIYYSAKRKEIMPVITERRAA